MNYFMKKENVDKYSEMVKDYNGSWLIDKLSAFLPINSSVLELGMGTGHDFDLLSKKYKVIGTDNSPIFIKNYKAKNSNANVMLLDAIHVDIDKTFNCIFSNKVLQHLTKEQFIESLNNQKRRLTPHGIIFMTLWEGKYREELMCDNQLRFTYYTKEDLIEIVQDNFIILDISLYKECENNDSILVVLQKL